MKSYVITMKDWGSIPSTATLEEVGLSYLFEFNFKVVNEQKFFLAVIKYGIVYKESCKIAVERKRDELVRSYIY